MKLRHLYLGIAVLWGLLGVIDDLVALFTKAKPMEHFPSFTFAFISYGVYRVMDWQDKHDAN